MPECPSLQLTMGNDLPSLSGAARTIETFLDGRNVGAKERYVVALAFEEMATNIIKYGFQNDGLTHQINVRLSEEDGVLRLTLEDSGVEFNPLNLDKPELLDPVENREVGGLGIHLVRQMASALEYRRENGRNVLTITVKRYKDGAEVSK